MRSRREFLAMLGCSAASIAGGLQPCEAAATGVAEIDRDGRYEGMDDSAGWRRDALRRIDEIRQQDFTLQLADRSGAPHKGVEVDLGQYRHHFGFGGGVRLERLFGDRHAREVRDEYLALSERLFHKVVSLNALKWKHIDRNAPYIESFFDWAERRELPVRGHTLVWPSFKRAPDHVSRFADDPVGLAKVIREHIERTVFRFRGRVAEWDVLNEPFTEHQYMDLLGENVVNDWFGQVKEIDPAAKRYVNDFGVLTRVSDKHREYYYEWLVRMLEFGAPIQGIGFQAHNPSRFKLTSPTTVLATLDKFADLDLDLQITEFDVETADVDLQARYTEDFLIAIFSHPKTVGLMTWTPFEYGNNVVSKPLAAFYDRRLNRKPNAEVWDRLINHEWITNHSASTDENGCVKFRGFAGKYNVRLANAPSNEKYTIEFTPTNRDAVIIAN